MDDTYDVSRRDVLKGGAALALGTSGLAGCMEEELPEPVEYDTLVDSLDEYSGDLVRTKGWAAFDEETVRTYVVMAGKVPVTQHDYDWWYNLHPDKDTDTTSLPVHDEHGKLPGYRDMNTGEFYDDKVEFTGRIKENDEGYFLELHEVGEPQQ